MQVKRTRLPLCATGCVLCVCVCVCVWCVYVCVLHRRWGPWIWSVFMCAQMCTVCACVCVCACMTHPARCPCHTCVYCSSRPHTVRCLQSVRLLGTSSTCTLTQRTSPAPATLLGDLLRRARCVGDTDTHTHTCRQIHMHTLPGSDIGITWGAGSWTDVCVCACVCVCVCVSHMKRQCDTLTGQRHGGRLHYHACHQA